MAGFLFVPYGAHGHVGPMLPVAAELAARGERVYMVVGERFAARARAVGATVVPGPEHEVRVPPGFGPRAAADRVGLWGRRRAVWWSALPSILGADRPDLVVVDPMVPWADRLVARLATPAVTFHTTHARSPAGRGRALVNSLPELQPRPHRFGSRFRFVGPLIDTTDESRTGRLGRGPVLLVSPGTVFARPARYFLDIARAFAGTEWTVLMATGHTAVPDGLPGNVVPRRWLPQLPLLRQATVLLTHGGINSVHEALSHGVPMLLSPRSREQRLTARRVIELGLGRCWSGRGRLRPLVEALATDERVAAAHQAMSTRLRGLRPAESAADELLRSVDRRGACRFTDTVIR